MSRDVALHRYTLLGALVVLLFFAVCGAWAVFARLADTVVAPGTVEFASAGRGVQHPDGGIVAEILVAEGEAVAAGDVLLRLDTTQASAMLAEARERYYALLAAAARLEAERDQAEAIAFPPPPDGVDLADGIEAIRGEEERLFATRRQRFEERRATAARRIGEFEEESRSLRDEIASLDRQIELLRDESASMESLFERGLVGELQLQTLQREIAALEGRRSRSRAAIARVGQSIGEEQRRVVDLEAARADEILKQLRETRERFPELAQRVAAAEDLLRSREVRAPAGGTVVDLAVSGIGDAVVSPQPFLAIVPDDEEERLMVRAQLSPQDLDAVRASQKAFVRTATLGQRERLPLEGRVASVSTERLRNEATGLDYFPVRIELPALNASSDGVRGDLRPGMAVEVTIAVGERSPLDYLLGPLRDSAALRGE